MSKKILICICAFILLHSLCAVSTAYAASLKISSFTFNQNERADVVGPGGDLEPDGKPDASFSLSVSGASAITEITVELKDSGTKWSTNTPKNFIALTGSDGQTINASGRVNVLPVLLAANYKLYISDADKEMAKETSCTVTVKLVDGSSVTATTNVVPLVTGQAVSSDTTDGIAEAKSVGVSGYDLAGSGKSIGADGAKDRAIKALFSFKNANIAGIKVQATEGSAKSTWDTLKGSGAPLLVVIDKNENIVNKADGSVSMAVSGSAEYTLLLHDSSGILAKPGSSAQLTVSLADGRVFERQIDKTKAAMTGNALTVSFKGKGDYDFVGENEEMKPNLNADLQIKAETRITGTVSGIKIKSAAGRVWDTIPSNGNRLLMVTDSTETYKLNKADGSVSITLSGPASLTLWFEEDSKSEGPFTVTFVLTNGQIIEAVTEKQAESGSDAREVKFVSAKPTVSNIDIVGKNKKLASDGNKDHSIKIKATGKGQIIAITLKDTSSAGWDTLTSNNGRWRLAVRDGNKTLNSANGTVKIGVDGTKELTLFAQNNGKLSAAKGKLVIEMTWSDGEVTQNTITW